MRRKNENKKGNPELKHFERRRKERVAKTTKETRERNKEKRKKTFPPTPPPIPFRPPCFPRANQPLSW
jgi:hypothetical protein